MKLLRKSLWLSWAESLEVCVKSQSSSVLCLVMDDKLWSSVCDVIDDIPVQLLDNLRESEWS